jgi:hypothetical protein
MTSWNDSGPIVTPFSRAIQHMAPWGWLTHQWWFIGGLLLVGLLLAHSGDREGRP